MKLCKTTQEAIKNVSSITQSIIFKTGESRLNTISAEKNILASIAIDETFPVDCAIYDLNSFLGAINLFDDPELTFNDTNVIISEGNNNCVFYYTDPSIVISPPEKDIKLPSLDVEFNLKEESIYTLLKASSVLGVEDIVIKGGDGKIVMQAADIKTSGSNSFTIELGEYSGGVFQASIKTYHIKLLPGSYNIQVCRDGISKWSNVNRDATYHVAMSMV